MSAPSWDGVEACPMQPYFHATDAAIPLFLEQIYLYPVAVARL